MTDAEIDRWNELARAQREAAMWMYVHDFNTHPMSQFATTRAMVAAKYPLKRRVRRENEWIRVNAHHRVRWCADLGYYHLDDRAARRPGDSWPDEFTAADARMRLQAWRQLVAQIDAADTVEDVTTWEDA